MGGSVCHFGLPCIEESPLRKKVLARPVCVPSLRRLRACTSIIFLWQRLHSPVCCKRFRLFAKPLACGLMPVPRHQSIAGKLPQIQAELPLQEPACRRIFACGDTCGSARFACRQAPTNTSRAPPVGAGLPANLRLTTVECWAMTTLMATTTGTLWGWSRHVTMSVMTTQLNGFRRSGLR